jgi:flagellar motility protein MotE (MotC chaperone)
MMKNYSNVKRAICIMVAAISIFPAASVSFGEDFKPPSISEIDFEFAQSLKAREEKVQELETKLQGREKELAQIQKEVDEKLANLLALQNEVKGQLEELDTSKDVQFRNLIKVYSAMSATKVSPLLNKMEDATVTQILRAMKADDVAKILPKLDPDKAVAVSQKLGMLNGVNVN